MRVGGWEEEAYAWIRRMEPRARKVRERRGIFAVYDGVGGVKLRQGMHLVEHLL